jgi:alanine dehydrogenase
VLILDRSLTWELLQLEPCVEGVERAFALDGTGGTLQPTRTHVQCGEGVFHLTAGGLAPKGALHVFGIKSNGRFPSAVAGGGQRVSGAILLQDGSDGMPMAILDSQAVTVMRTAAVTVVACRHLARAGSTRALLVGAGRQAAAQVEALFHALPLESLTIWSRNTAHARRVVGHAQALGIDAKVPKTAAEAAQTSDVIMTVTPSTSPLLFAGDIAPGCLVIALGADGPGKQELDPAILAESKVVVDIFDQAASSGELAHALDAGLMTKDDVYAELGEIVAGTKTGRTTDDETIVFDSTGTALQDVAASLVIVKAARDRGLGVDIDLGD